MLHQSTLTTSGRIALVEDDPNIRMSTKIFLVSQGFYVEVFNSAETFMKAYPMAIPFDVIILDLNLPGSSGLKLCEEMKKKPDSPAVIIVTAQSDEQTAVRCFEMGADDFVRKPFGLAELKSRLQRLLLISTKVRQLPSVSGISMDSKSRCLIVGAKKVGLTRTEFLLVQTLLTQFGSIVSREFLAFEMELSLEASDRALDVHMSRIRSKLNQANLSEISIQSIYGKGYLLEKINENS